MNEWIFVAHIFIVIAFIFAALRLGKTALIAVIALQGVLANLFVVKQMILFGFAVTCSDVFAIGSLLSLNLLQEYFGKEVAKKAIKISLLTLLFFAFMAQVHLAYAPAAFDETHVAFRTIFAQSLRILFASIGTFYLVQQFDIRFFSMIKAKLPLRIGISLLCSQLLDTTLFSFLGLYGFVASILDVIIISFFIKCIIIGVSAPFTAFSKRFVKSALPI